MVLVFNVMTNFTFFLEGLIYKRYAIGDIGDIFYSFDDLYIICFDEI